jgi:hypothetical protein
VATSATNVLKRWRRAGTAALGALAVLGVGCGLGPTESEWRLELSYIYGFQEDDPDLSVETVGDSVHIRVMSYGGCGFHREGLLSVAIYPTARIVHAVPYDRVRRVTGICLDQDRFVRHSRTVGPLEAGAWLVQVSGRAASGDTVFFDRPVQVTDGLQ